MNSAYSKYQLFEKTNIPITELTGCLKDYDRFLSAFNESERVRTVFDQVSASSKHWVVFPQYGISSARRPSGHVTVCSSVNEDEAIQEYFARNPLAPGAKLCIDITGFIRPHLLYLLRYLYEHEWQSVEMLYSEPVKYQRGSETKFSGDVTDVRQIRGFEGTHTPDPDGEFLVVGCGYDSDLMAVVANSRVRAKKLQLFPFPSLRPHMYQENRLRTQECQEAFGAVLRTLFAPGYDPFSTAQVLSHALHECRNAMRNLYLSPLATKAQVVGFGIFFLMECIDRPVSIIFPFSDLYNRETSIGLSEVWRYRIDFSMVRSMQLAPKSGWPPG